MNANATEAAVDFLTRAQSRCPLPIGSLPVLYRFDDDRMGNLMPSVIANSARAALVAYDGLGSVSVPPGFALDSEGGGWAIVVHGMPDERVARMAQFVAEVALRDARGCHRDSARDFLAAEAGE